MSKLNPDSNCLWQRPKKKVHNADPVWYDNSPVGRDPLNNTMKNLSANAGPSMVYKNHSIRATVVTKLDNKGFEARHIMAKTGHKLEISIKNYARKCPTRKRREMSDALAKSLIPEDNVTAEKKRKKEVTLTKTEPTILDDITVKPEENPPNFELANAELETINNNDLSDIFAFDDEIESPDILSIVSQIEQENANMPPPIPNVPKAPKTINVSNVQNIQHRLRNMLPTMHFPNSNVTINYHFHN